jgi:aminobenzoyl-glutamate utilization protein B
MRKSLIVALALTIVGGLSVLLAQAPPRASSASAQRDPRVDTLERLKKDAALRIDALHVQTQQMIDQVFSFGELGFQEFETTKYLTDILKKNGFTVQRDVQHANRLGYR